MCLLFETIRIVDGYIQHREWHERRMNQAVKEVWNIHAPFDLLSVIKVPLESLHGIVRCNIHYGPEIKSVTFEPYLKKTIRSLKLVECNTIDYHLKYSDRTLLENLLSRKGDCDEIIIIKNGFITDTSISNLIFFDGRQWITPKNPLLNGTCRQRLLHQKKIVEAEIKAWQLSGFTGVKIINAMRDQEEEEMILINHIEV